MENEESQNIKFVKILNQYEKLVFSICYRMTRNYFDSQDLTQETFLSVYKSMNTFDGANEKAFVTKIATNKCLDYLKRAERRTKPSEGDEIERGSPPTASAEKQVMEILIYADVAVDENIVWICESVVPRTIFAGIIVALGIYLIVGKKKESYKNDKIQEI